jgi:uncharacterized protein (DUF362 family)
VPASRVPAVFDQAGSVLAGPFTTGRPEVDALTEAVCADVIRLFGDWRGSGADNDRLARRVWLMVLEREQIAAVAYRSEDVLARVDALDISAEFASVLRQTLAWVWKDEEMHVDYARARLARAARPTSTFVILGHQLFGAISGWVSVTSNHAERRRLSVRTLAARVVVQTGRLLGQIPPELADALRHRLTFRSYCDLNIALEASAALGYELLLEHADPATITDLQRITEDERRHARCFAILADAFDEHDRLRPEATERSVIELLANVSASHLPAHIRGPLSGTERTMYHGDVRVVRSLPPVAPQAVDEVLWPMLDQLDIPSPVGKVAIKASFTLGYHRADMSNINSPEALDSLCRYLWSRGASDIVVSDAGMLYDNFFANRSVRELAQYFGFTSGSYRVVDVADDQVEVPFDRGLAQHTISAHWKAADFRVVVAKLRGDPTEVAHLCLDSMQGMGQRTDTAVHIDREIEFRTAVMMTLDVAPPDLSIVDGWGLCGDGPLGLMGCNRPVVVDRFWASRSIVAVDAAVVADLGEDPNAVVILRRARDWFGVDLTVDPDHIAPVTDAFRRPKHSLYGRFICFTAYPMYLLFSGRGRWFVPAFDPIAFPEFRRASLPVRMVRRSAQLAFGLRPPAH